MRPIRHDERARLAAVTRSGLLDPRPDPTFDRAARLVARTLGAPVGLVSIVTAERQFFRGQHGLAGAAAAERGTPISSSFCRHVVERDGPLVVGDARHEPLVATNPAVDDLGVRAYVGVPLRDEEGTPLGSVCAIDHRPRDWTETDVELLDDLSGFLQAHLTLRATAREVTRAARRLGSGRGPTGRRTQCTGIVLPGPRRHR